LRTAHIRPGENGLVVRVPFGIGTIRGYKALGVHQVKELFGFRGGEVGFLDKVIHDLRCDTNGCGASTDEEKTVGGQGNAGELDSIDETRKDNSSSTLRKLRK
jgi:hypothetical protein